MKKNVVRVLALVLVALMCLSLIPLAAHAESHVHFYEPVTVPATCAQNGYVQMICEACGDGGEILSFIPPTGEHSFIPVEAEEYLIEKGDCTHPYQYWKSCSVCQQSAEEAYSAALQKMYEELNARKQSGEKADWEQIVKDRVLLLDERYKFSAGGEGHHIIQVEHQEATCTSDGWKDYTYCDVCGEYFHYERIPAKGHRWNEFTVTKAPTCTEDGSRERVCDVCGEKEVQVLPALGHKGEFTVTKDYTCTEPGSKERICTVCHEKEIVAIPAAHRWGVFTVTMEPTCYSTGEKQHSCLVCGAVESVWIDMAHKYENGVCVYCGEAAPVDASLTFNAPADPEQDEQPAAPAEESAEEAEEVALENPVYIHFDGNGATSGSMEPQAFEAGSSNRLNANTFTRRGYSFRGWDVAADGSVMGDEPFLDGEEVEVNSDVTLYAQWAADPEAESAAAESSETAAFEANGLTISFNGNGMTSEAISGSMDPLNVPSSDEGGVYLTPNQFEHGEVVDKDGKRAAIAFTGWNTQADGSGKFFEDKQFVSANDFTSYDTDVTLYAQWVAIQVIFDPNGGSGTMDNQFINGTPQPLKENTFSCPGRKDTYTFAGWDTDPEGHGQHFSDEQVVSTADITAPIVLYAQWKRNIIVTYQSNVDSGSGKKSYAEPMKYPGDSITIKTLDETGIPTKANRSFVEWNTKRDGTGTSYKPGDTMYLTEDEKETPSRIMLYAQWGFDVTFDANGGVGSMDTLKAVENKALDLSVDATNQYSKEDSYFAGWNTLKDGTGIAYADGATIPASEMTGPFTLYAQWKSNQITVSFNANGGTGTMEAQEGKIGTALGLNPNTSITREAYVFTGWNTQADGSGKAYADGALIPAEDVTDSFILYAQWKKGVTVTFDANGGTGTMDKQPGVFGVELKLNENVFTKENAYFTGWNTQADGEGTAYKDEATIPASVMTEDFTLYAQWKNYIISITFDPNYGEDGTGTGAMEDQKINIEEDATLNKNAFTRTDGEYAFAGWNTQADGKGEAYANEAKILAGEFEDDITLYAQWEKTEFTVSFHPNGGSGSMDPQTAKKGEKLTLNPVQTSDGEYKITKVKSVFVCWNTKKDGSGIDYEDGATITVNGDMTLYAKWDYAIVFYPNGGSGTMNRQSIELGKTVLLDANTYTRSNYSFDHWNTKADDSGESYANQGEITPTSSMALYAQWDKTSYSVNYERNGGGGTTMTPNTVSRGTKGTVKANSYIAPDSSKVFGEWQDVKTGTSYAPGDLIPKEEIDPGYNTDIVLKAIWRDKVSVWFYPGDGGGTASSLDYPEGSQVKLPSYSTLKFEAPANQSFAGWQLASGEKRYKAGQIVVFGDEDKEEGDVVYTSARSVTAHWDDTITLTYDQNFTPVTTSRKLQRVAKNSVTKLASMEQIGYTRPGYEFVGWALSSAAKEAKYADAETIPNGFSQDTTLYAVWKQHIFTGVVTISGNLSSTDTVGYVGETLTAIVTGEKLFTDYSYQWMRDGEEIPGATAEIYVPTSDDFNCILTCDVTANDALEDKTKTSENFKFIYIVEKDKRVINNGQTEVDYVYGAYSGMYYSINNGAKQLVTISNGAFPVSQQGTYRFYKDLSSTSPLAVANVVNWWTVGYNVSTGSSSDNSGSGSVTFKRGSTTLSSSTILYDDSGTRTDEHAILKPYTLSGYSNVWIVRQDAGITDITMTVKPSSGSYGHVSLNNGSYDSSSAERVISLGSINQAMLYNVVFNKSSTSPRTADLSHLGLWSALCFTSFVGTVSILGSARKHRKERGEQ